MDGLVQIVILVTFLLGGAVLARLHGAPPPRFVDFFIKIALWALLLAMGFRIGNDRAIAVRLAEIGLLAGAAALFSVSGTVLALFLLLGTQRKRRRRRGPGEVATTRFPLFSRLSHLKAPLFLLGLVAMGFLLGTILPSTTIDLSVITGWALNILLFFVGMQFVQAGISLKGALLRPETLAVPLATALGSLGGGLLLVPLFGIGPGKALALAGGFGWYSLSGVLIADMGDPALGSAAFLANMIRESIALISIPFLGRTTIPELAVGVGGATSMDVTLPLIEQSAGPDIVPLSFASGALLSLSVPILVPLFFRMG